MSPILVRPVREQLEHDRIIRLLPARYRRRFEVGINPGLEQNAPVGTGPAAVFPDAVLYAGDKGRKVLAVAEVETVESVNHLEAMSQWASLSRLKVPFHLYVPASAIDVARRMAIDYQVLLTELWSYDNVGDQVRFTLIQRASEPAMPLSTKAPAHARKASRPAAPTRPPAPAPRARVAARRARSGGKPWNIGTGQRQRKNSAKAGRRNAPRREPHPPGRLRRARLHPEKPRNAGRASCRVFDSPATSGDMSTPSSCTRPDVEAGSAAASCTGFARRRPCV